MAWYLVKNGLVTLPELAFAKPSLWGRAYEFDLSILSSQSS